MWAMQNGLRSNPVERVKDFKPAAEYLETQRKLLRSIRGKNNSTRSRVLAQGRPSREFTSTCSNLMANTQDIRRRIKSIRNTAQITKAMQMVAASKMRKAQQQALAGRPYATLMNKVLVSLQQRTDPRTHPLLQIRPVEKELVIVMSTDKGLAGALNTNLFREVSHFEPSKSVYVVTGRKARLVTRTTGARRRFELKDSPSFVERSDRKSRHEKILSGEVDKVLWSTRNYQHAPSAPVLRTLRRSAF